MQNPNIILIGMPASGKSTVGVILAKILGMDFLDTDLVIQKKEGLRLEEIITQKGTEGFLAVEEKAVTAVNVCNTVIATGGSVVYSEAAMRHLKKDGITFYLKVEKEALFRRLSDVRQRGVVLKPGETLEALYNERILLYEKYADHIVSEDGFTIEDTVQETIRQLEGHILNR
ncbi:MAG: shikimate kinase [Blautia sp.]|nr:shikimate kinase [Blautia sp.]